MIDMEIEQDIPVFFRAITEWLSFFSFTMLYRQYHRKGMAGKSGFVLFILMCFHWVSDQLDPVMQLVLILLSSVILILALKASLDISRRTILYTSARVFLYAEFVASFQWQLYNFYFGKTVLNNVYFANGFAIVVFAVLFLLIYQAEKRLVPSGSEDMVLVATAKEVAIAWGIAVFFFIFGNLSYVSINTAFSGQDEFTVFNIRTLVDFSGILLLYIFHMQKMDGMEREEKMAIQSILDKQYLQYRRSQENIDLINRKYHDLKNQLQVIRQEMSEEKRQYYLKELESGLERYGSEYKTGNTALDTILMEKGTSCLNQNIRLTVVADGMLMNFMHVMDLCSIFGNALDNALEYVSGIEDPEKRLIHLVVTQKKGYVVVRIENYYDGEDIPAGKLPVSTKGDFTNHGFGLKSIRMTVEKYKGHMSVTTEHHWFRLDMLFPVDGPQEDIAK